MERHLPERDWKTLRGLHPVALDRFCERILAEVGSIASDTSRSNHERYLAIFTLIERRNRQIEDAFDDMRRSMAVIRLLHMCKLGLVQEEEFARFSDDIRGTVEHMLGPVSARGGS